MSEPSTSELWPRSMAVTSRTALEVGCSIGVFTELLAARCDQLVAVDVSRLAVALAPGGSLLAVHGRFESRSCPLKGDEVHDLLAAHSSLQRGLSLDETKYRLDRLDRPS